MSHSDAHLINSMNWTS